MRRDVSVLFDFSAMAPVAADQSQYTGVQRVVHEVAAGLASGSEVDLHLYGGSARGLCQRFAAHDQRLRTCPFTEVTGQRWINLALEWLDRLMRAKPDSRAFLVRLIRKCAATFFRAISRSQARLTDEILTTCDIFHSPAYAFPPAVLQSPHIKKFLTVYDLTPLKVPQHSHSEILREYRQMLESVPRECYYLCISENTKKDWCEHMGVDPTRCFVTPLAAGEHFAPCSDLEKIERIRQKYQLPSGRYYLSVSTLEPRKNLLCVIRAFLDLLNETNDDSLYLALVGRRGWHEEEIFKAAETPLARQRIIFTGYVSEEDLSALYSGALAFVYMSFYEGFGLPPLEAMQCGTPVVTSNVSSLPEVVGTAGIMLDPHDQAGLCETMRRLGSDDALRESLRARALERSRLFTWERCTALTLAAYRQALE